jgi:hypothetical protein
MKMKNIIYQFISAERLDLRAFQHYWCMCFCRFFKKIALPAAELSR